MAQYTIDDPDLVEKKSVDSEGRIYLGKDYQGKDVRIALEIIDED